MSHSITDLESARTFIYAGNARFTLRSEATGTRFTFRVRKSEDEGTFFVQILSGSDNESAYQYVGFIKAHTPYTFIHGGRKARAKADAPSVRAIGWFIAALRTRIPKTVELWHEGRCGRCGRALTVPESIATGIGPECSRKTLGATPKAERRSKTRLAKAKAAPAPDYDDSDGQDGEDWEDRAARNDAEMARIEAEGDRALTLRDEDAKAAWNAAMERDAQAAIRATNAEAGPLDKLRSAFAR